MSHPGTVTDDTGAVVSMEVVRRLTLVSARISAGSSLSATLQVVVDGIVDALGFGAAVINHLTPDGERLQVVAAAGPAGIRRLMGSLLPLTTMQTTLERAVPWGALRYLPHDRADEFDLGDAWVPDLVVSEDPEDWHPEDALLAPLFSEQGQLVGVISVDLPPGNRLPDPVLRELLELFAMHAGIAVAAVELRERYERERAAYEALLHDLAHRDALTGLPNRRVLDERLALAVQAARAGGTPSALLFCDVDGLKQLNDQEGHARGDCGLRAWAAELGEAVRADDLVCRIGGDEFVIVANAVTPEAVDHLVDRLRTAGETSARSQELLGLTLSVGIAFVDGLLGPDEVLARADAAMYVDKLSRAPRRPRAGEVTAAPGAPPPRR